MNKKNIIILFLLIPCYFYGQGLKVSSNGRYLQTSFDTPFLWMGDTAWELLHKLDREDTKLYLKTRKKQGFNVIQTVVLAEDSGLTKGNAYGQLPFIDLDPACPNEAYFQHVDYVVALAEKMGFYIALLPTWGDKVPSDRPGDGPIIFNAANAESYGKFLAKRYAGKPIIWILGGDRNVNEENKSVWEAMARGLSSVGRSLISYHPAGESSSSIQLHQEKWLSFNLYQSGHAKRFMEVYRFAQHDYAMSPSKPFLDAEPAYEDIPIKFWEHLSFAPNTSAVPDGILNTDGTIKNKAYFTDGFFDDRDIRIAAYWNILSGACGYTYGNNAVWQLFSKNGKSIIPCLHDWKDALHRPAAKQMKHLRRLFEKRSFAKLQPCQQLLLSENRKDSTYIAAALSEDKTYAVIYSPFGKEFQLDVNLLLSDNLKGYWYNPRNGRSKKMKIRNNILSLPISPPSKMDWVAILETADIPQTNEKTP